MTGGVFKVTIDAPPEAVWSWVADMSTHPQWSPKPYTMEWISGEPNQVGSRYRSVGVIPGDKDHQNEGEILTADKPTRFAFRADDNGGAFSNDFELQAVGEGSTEVTHSLQFPQMKGMAAVLLPILFPLTGKPQIRKRMQMLKAKVEGTA